MDDTLIVSRRVIEDICRTTGEDWFLLSLFDIEKAYPRVCRGALWDVLRRQGCPEGMVKVCQALHEHTAYMVRCQGGLSSKWVPERGLREGCPSSPPLFNIYHDAVMQDFRQRRKRTADEAGLPAGIPWQYKVDGKLVKRSRFRKESTVGHGKGFCWPVSQGYCQQKVSVSDSNRGEQAIARYL